MPTSRLAEIWNALPGATPVKKFKDRATGVARIWKVIQAAPSTAVPEAPVEAAEPIAAERANKTEMG